MELAVFSPSVEQILANFGQANHYRTVMTADSIAIEAHSPEDHALALAFMREAKREGWISSPAVAPAPVPIYPAQAPSAVQRSAPLTAPPETLVHPEPEAAAEPPLSPSPVPTVAPRQEPDDDTVPEPAIAAGIGEDGKVVRRREHPIDQTDAKASKRLYQRGRRYRTSLKPKKSPSSTLGNNELVIDLLIDLVGNKHVWDVTEDDIELFVDSIADWPANVGRRKDLAAKSRLQLLQLGREESLEPIGNNTREKYIKAVMTFFSACVKSGDITTNPCSWIALKNYRKGKRQLRDTLERYEIQRVLDECMRSNEPLKFWGFLIALLTSMRSNEICQLEVADVRTMEWMEDGGIERSVPYFYVNDGGVGQHIKNEKSLRAIPIHPMLIEFGFLNYVEDVRNAGAVHLFPGLSWNDRRPGKSLSNFVNKTLRACGITSKRKVLHSTRHTWLTLADRCNMPQSGRRTINGHSDGSDLEQNTYTSRATMEECVRYIEELKFPYLQFRPYRPSVFNAPMLRAIALEEHETRLRKAGKKVDRRGGKKKADGTA
jgi:integrase